MSERQVTDSQDVAHCLRRLLRDVEQGTAHVEIDIVFEDEVVTDRYGGLFGGTARGAQARRVWTREMDREGNGATVSDRFIVEDPEQHVAQRVPPLLECTTCGCTYTGVVRAGMPCPRCPGTIVDTEAVVGAVVRHYDVAMWLVRGYYVNARPPTGRR